MKRFNPHADAGLAGEAGSMVEAPAGAWVRYEDAMAEIARLHKALAPILRHAAGDDKQPPLRLNIEETRVIKKEVLEQGAWLPRG
ncbi:hypothetical protein GTA51_04170 [Desulfovibrio aerotolerans]|uniref:Uncharacterized protein n=1 Tax=Solidesulfovibrio aerotolerans TaxID=295255 RepID=A0A7C9MJR7_9BACT|nr:hypothetical protein [Solidesulfovibrio aerotolerans]MYL82333.1 hypothetical protein [Solidesulfovibrio aerotolerans]